MNKLERRAHVIGRDHGQSRSKPFGDDESPPVISRRHTQHIGRCIQLRQLVPNIVTCKLDAFTNRTKHLCDTLTHLALANDSELHVGKLRCELNERTGQQVNTFARDQRSAEQKHALRSPVSGCTAEPFQVGKVRQVEIRSTWSKLSSILIDGKLSDRPDWHGRIVQSRELPSSQQASTPGRPRGLPKPGTLAPETPWTTTRSTHANQLRCMWVSVVVEDDEIRFARRVSRVPRSIRLQIDRLMENVRRRPLPLRIAVAQVSNLQLAVALRFDLVEELDLIRRWRVGQYENFHGYSHRPCMSQLDEELRKADPRQHDITHEDQLQDRTHAREQRHHDDAIDHEGALRRGAFEKPARHRRNPSIEPAAKRNAQ